MKKQNISDALNNIDFDMVEDVYEATKTRKKAPKSLWLKWGAVAACLCICLTALTLNTLYRMDYFEDTCASYIGSVVDGTYYYEVQREGIYSYDETNGTVKVLSSYWFDDWSVNEYGIYYNRGKTLYVLPHGAEKSEKLYSASSGSRIDFSAQPNGSIKVSVVGKTDGKYETLQVFLPDGVTGELIEGNPSETVYRIGGRELAHVKNENGCDVLEDGISILPDGMTVGGSPEAFEDGIMFFVGLEGSDVWSYYVVLSDGSEHAVKIAGDPPFAVYDNYVIYLKDHEFRCLDVRNNESWELGTDSDELPAYEFVLDGTTIYSCVPWSEAQTCRKLNIDADGRPTSVSTVAENIIK